MNAADRERVKELLSRAAQIPPHERAAYLEQAAGGDRHILAEALELLRTLDDPTFMSAPTGAGLSGALDPNGALREGPGSRIGRYKLLQLIGEGGFGAVFMAEQAEPVVRRVALKIIKAGMDTAQVIARFEAERQALALMDHPNIARVLDAGATDSGRPYFVMELVRGEPVTDYCDRERLPVPDRLKLFRDVCHAVQHAHQKGIIHRDLKPSNVLVTIADSEPLPKVIDFGIAKATAGRLTDKTLFTEIQQLIGTPQYMSPEQAEISGVDIDTRSDVYTLGVLLYELLSGTTPLEGGRLRAMPLAELQRAIREEEPPRPSTRVSSLAVKRSDFRFPISDFRLESGAAAANRKSETLDNASRRQGQVGNRKSSALDIASQRRTDPQTLTRALRGDLDWIVMKCLEKDRRRRYATASALAEDIGRYLADQPVLATPPSAGYKLRKFVRRNKAPAAAITVVALALVLGLAGTLWQAGIARREATAAQASARAEKQRAEELKRVADFQSQMLSEIDVEAMGRGIKQRFAEQVRAALAREWVGEAPNRRPRTPEEIEAELAQFEQLAAAAQGVDIARHVVDDYVLERAAKALDQRFAEQPLVQAQLRDAIGSTYQALGLYDVAEPHLRSALELHRRELGDEHPDVANSLNNLAALLQANGDYAAAEPLYREALGLYRKLLGDEHPDVASGLNNLASLLQGKGEYAAAEPLFREALALRRKLLGDEHPHVAQSLNNLARLLQDKGDYAAAEPLLREALALGRKLLGNAHPDVANRLNNLAMLLKDRGDFAAAEPLLREALALRRKLLGDEHPHVATSMNNLAWLLKDKGDYAEAELLDREALALRRKLLGDEHPDVASSLNTLAMLLKDKGDYIAAEHLFREALALRRKLLGDEHPHVATSANNLAALLNETGDYAAAEPLLREGLALQRKLVGDEHPQVAVSLTNLAALLKGKGDFAAAEPLFREALALFRKLLGDEHPHTAYPLDGLGAVLLKLGRHDEAVPLLRQCLEIRTRVLADDHPQVWLRYHIMSLLGQALAEQAKFAEAKPLLADGCAGLTAQAERIPARVREERVSAACQALTKLYEAWQAAEPDPAAARSKP